METTSHVVSKADESKAVVDIGNGLSLRERSVDGDSLRELSTRRITLLRDAKPVAQADLVPVELTSFSASAADNKGVVLRSLSTATADPQVLPALLYCAARRARMMGRVSVVIGRDEALADQAQALLRMAPLAPNRGHILAQRVDRCTHYAHQALERQGTPVGAAFRADEVQQVADQWLATAPSWGFFKAVHSRTLTRPQYVYALSNIYQFVRHTTRLCARAVAASPTTELRTHWINHLSGEVNHELIIERDLHHLGEDVDFVRHHMAPNGPTQEFMAIQESLISYYQDPILLMASPVAAEGVTGHLTPEFIEALKDCMRGWGIEHPDRSSKFFVSHMHYDGGDDGHWEMTLNFLAKCLVDESKHQFFMRSLFSSMRATGRLYDSFVADIPRVEESQAASADARAVPAAHA